MKESLKAYWAPGLFFEELDIAYMGVIDGHDVGALREAIGEALEAGTAGGRPLQDREGQGLRPRRGGRARGDGEVARGQAGVDRERRCRRAKPKPAKAPEPAPAAVHEGVRRGAGGRGAARRARDRDHRRDELGHRPGHPPARAARPLLRRRASPSSTPCCSPPGLALQGAKPVAAIYSTFLQRGFDQIVHDVCLQKLDVVFAMDRAGLVGDDGPTHHGAFDISYLRGLPNIVLMAPRDEAQLVHMLRTALVHEGPVGAALPARRGGGRAAAGLAVDARARARRAAA